MIFDEPGHDQQATQLWICSIRRTMADKSIIAEANSAMMSFDVYRVQHQRKNLSRGLLEDAAEYRWASERMTKAWQ